MLNKIIIGEAPKLSILIPTVPVRAQKLSNLVTFISSFCASNNLSIQIITMLDNPGEHSVGVKRNILRDKCDTEYSAFIDDDDMITEWWFNNTFKGIEEAKDVIEVIGMRNVKGVLKSRLFELSIQYHEFSNYKEGNTRFITHLNPIRTSLVKHIRFPDQNLGEDNFYSDRVRDAGVLKTEYSNPKKEIMYLYNFDPELTLTQSKEQVRFYKDHHLANRFKR